MAGLRRPRSGHGHRSRRPGGRDGEAVFEVQRDREREDGIAYVRESGKIDAAELALVLIPTKISNASGRIVKILMASLYDE